MPLILPAPLKARLDVLTRRERILLALGAAAILAFLVYLLLPARSDSEGDFVEAPIAPAYPPVPPPPPTAAPAAAALPSASVDGLALRGVLGGGPGGGAAIIGFPDGSQRAIRVGREFLPGVTLREVTLHHVILATGGGAMRLEFNKAIRADASGAVAPASPAAASQDERRRRETLEYRTGLAPRVQNGRTIGFAIRPDAQLPILQRAGLRPGDVIVAVNGQAFESEEKVIELSGEIAGAYTAEFDYIRAGRRMKGSVEVNPRPQ